MKPLHLILLGLAAMIVAGLLAYGPVNSARLGLAYAQITGRAQAPAAPVWPGEVACHEFCADKGGADRIDWWKPEGPLCTCANQETTIVEHGE